MALTDNILLKTSEIKTIKTDLLKSLNALGGTGYVGSTDLLLTYPDKLSKVYFDSLITPMFANGELGFVYDVNDLGTLFQDAAGTTAPVVGSPVGLILDKSKGLVLGSDARGTYTLVSGSTTSATFDSSTGIGTVSRVSSSDLSAVRFTGLTVPGFYYLEITNQSTTAAITVRTSNEATVLVTIAASGTWKGYVQPNTTNNNISIVGGTDSTSNVAFKVTTLKLLPGNHAYQSISGYRPILRKNATTGSYYLEFDGVDDFLQTNTINMTGTELSLFVGVNKLTDGSYPNICYFSPSAASNWSSSNGTFILAGGNGAGYAYGVRGTSTNVQIPTGTALNAPNKAVLSLVAKLAGSGAGYIRPKHNGTAYNWVSVTDTGSLGSNILYISNSINSKLTGHIYCLVGMNRVATDIEVSAMEQLLSKRIGVTLG